MAMNFGNADMNDLAAYFWDPALLGVQHIRHLAGYQLSPARPLTTTAPGRSPGSGTGTSRCSVE